MAAKSSKCEMDNCDRPAKSCGLCGACYQRVRFWKSKSMAAIGKRSKNLRIFSATLRIFK